MLPTRTYTRTAHAHAQIMPRPMPRLPRRAYAPCGWAVDAGVLSRALPDINHMYYIYNMSVNTQYIYMYVLVRKPGYRKMQHIVTYYVTFNDSVRVNSHSVTLA